MAFKEVTADQGEAGEFVRFNAIDDQMQGVFMGSRPSTGQHAKEGDRVFKFLCRNGEKLIVKLVDGPVNAQVKLRKAEREGTMKPGMVVKLQYIDNQDTGHANPMRVIKLLVDDEIKPAALEAIKKHAAAPAPAAPKPPPADDSDLPF